MPALHWKPRHETDSASDSPSTSDSEYAQFKMLNCSFKWKVPLWNTFLSWIMKFWSHQNRKVLFSWRDLIHADPEPAPGEKKCSVKPQHWCHWVWRQGPVFHTSLLSDISNPGEATTHVHISSCICCNMFPCEPFSGPLCHRTQEFRVRTLIFQSDPMFVASRRQGLGIVCFLHRKQPRVCYICICMLKGPRTQTHALFCRARCGKLWSQSSALSQLCSWTC